MKAAGLSWFDVAALASLVLSALPLLFIGVWALVKGLN